MSSTIQQEYLSLKNLAQKYDLHPDTIRSKNLIEGIHFIRIDKSVRYHVKNMHQFLTKNTKTNNQTLDRFLID